MDTDILTVFQLTRCDDFQLKFVLLYAARVLKLCRMILFRKEDRSLSSFIEAVLSEKNSTFVIKRR